MKSKLLALFCASSMSLAATANAQDIGDMSLEDMLGIKTNIATKRALTQRESPAIVSIVTRDEIVKSGARDLKEILEFLVPGIYIGAEIEGVSGVGIRGIWAFDSRMLLMIDGIDVNEDVFGAFVVGNHYPAEMIDKVEVIRGPGSVIYGGYAAVGVVNVVTRGAGSAGGSISGRYSQMSKTYSARNVTVARQGGSDNFKYDVTLTAGQGQRGEGDQYDTAGGSADMTNDMDLDPQVYTLGMKYKGVEWKGIVDLFRTKYVYPGWVNITDERYVETFRTYATQIQYGHQLSDKLKMTPKYDFKRTEPWKLRDLDPDPANNWEFAKKSERHRAGLHFDWEANEQLGVIAGLEYTSLKVSHLKEAEYDPDVASIKDETQIAYVEGTYASELGRFILGGRYEKPKIVEGAFVPRVGWTRAWDKVHSKFMVAQSFRAPVGIQPARADAGDKLKPEIMTNIEFEAGYQISPQRFLVANVFDIKADEALVYGAGQSGGYDNEGEIGTRGFEAEYRFKESRYDYTLSLAYYEQTDTTVDSLKVPDEDKAHRGAPQMRATLRGGYKINDQLGVHPTVAYFGERYGQDKTGGVVKFDPAVVANLNFRYMNAFTQGFHLTAGVMNVTDADLPIVQGYDNSVAAVPSNQRAYNVMATYEF